MDILDKFIISFLFNREIILQSFTRREMIIYSHLSFVFSDTFLRNFVNKSFVTPKLNTFGNLKKTGKIQGILKNYRIFIRIS